MKAVTFDETGGPEVIEINDREVPMPEEDEILI